MEPSRFQAAVRRLTGMYILCAIWGGTQVIAYDHVGIYYLFSLLLAGMATSWAIADSRTRDKHFPEVLRIIYFLTWPLASLFFLIWTRKFRGVRWWIVNAMGMYATIAIVFYGCYCLLYCFGGEDLIDPALFE